MRKFSTKLMAVVLTIIMIVGTCLPAFAVDKCRHEHATQEGAPVAATCSQNGYTPYYCSDCNKHILKDITAKDDTKHSFVETGRLDATCTEDGYVDYECEWCHTTKRDVLAAAESGHNYEETARVDATCTTAGSITYTCSACGDVKVTEIAATGHNYETVTEPTCTVDGSKKCSNCGDVQAIPAAGHEYVADRENPETVLPEGTCVDGWMVYKCLHCEASYKVKINAEGTHTLVEVAEVAPTCSVAGTKAHWHCTVCEKNFLDAAGTTVATAAALEIAKLPHTPGAPATCTNPQVCTVCDEVVYGALGHTEVIIPAVPATCTSVGYTEGKKCSVCDTILEAPVEVEKLEHTWDAGTVTQDPTCSTEGVKLFTCTVCGETMEVAIPTTEGGHVIVNSYEAPTCTLNGHHIKYCRLCDYVEFDEIIPALGHDTEHKLPFDKIEPTCSAPGRAAGSACPRCGEVIEGGETLPVLPHAYNEGVITTPATCTTAGEKTFTCTACGNTKIEVVDPLGHSYSAWTVVTEATCTLDGSQTRTCTVCGDVDTETIPALGHTELVQLTKPATCVAGGYDYMGCDRCKEMLGDKVPGTETPIDPNGHDLVVSAVTRPATCQRKGEVVTYCTLCDAKDIIILTDKDPNNHVWDAGTLVDNCEEGKVVKLTCPCGAVSYDEDTRERAPGHNYGEWTVTSPATCVGNGSRQRICANDASHIETEEIPATGHTYGDWEVVTAATCTTAGLKKHTCTVCLAVETEPIEALGHDYGEWIVTTPATCTTPGSKERICKRTGCGDVDTETIPTLVHVWGTEYTVTQPATCIAPGLRHKTCTLCGVADADEIIPIDDESHRIGTLIEVLRPASCKDNSLQRFYCADCGKDFTVTGNDKLPHEWDAGVVTQDPTCEETGVKTFTCNNCGDTKTEEIPATGHIYGTLIAKVDATCVDTGFAAHYKCEACGKLFDETFVEKTEAELTLAALGHTFTVTVAGTPATCTDTGIKDHFKCSVCEALGLADESGVVTAVEEADLVIAALGHTPGAAATCTTAQFCTVCSVELAPATGHTLVHHDAKPATCTTTGWDAYDTCENCAYTTFVELPALGHEPLETIVVPGTCTSYGFTLHVCPRCLETLKWTEDPADVDYGYDVAGVYGITIDTFTPATGHHFTKEVIVTPATCTENGLKKFVCVDCDEVEMIDGEEHTEVLPAIGHVNVDGKPLVEGLTCEEWKEAGFTAADLLDETKHVCANCGNTIAFTHTDMTDEYFEEGCGEWNFYVHRCNGCGIVNYEIDAEKNPDHDWQTVTEAATCSATGKTYEKCSHCGEIRNKVILDIDPDAHNYELVNTLPATCTEAKVLTYKCTLCEHEKTETDGNPLGHEEVLDTENSVAATYLTEGVNVFKCSRCDIELRRETIAKTTGMFLSFDVVNPYGGNFVNTGYVDIKVMMTASEVGVSDFQLTINYDKTKVAPVGLVGASDDVKFDTTRGGGNDGQFDVFSLNNKKVDTTINGEKALYVTIRFQILKDAYSTGTTASTADFSVAAVICKNKDGAEIAVASGAIDSINIVKLGCLTGDLSGQITVNDLRLMNLIIFEGAAYKAEADIDKDGEITYEDLVALQRLIIHEISYEEMISA